MSDDSYPIITVSKLGSQWHTADPFLFCVHHIDHYPAGNEKLGPAVPPAGRDLGATARRAGKHVSR